MLEENRFWRIIGKSEYIWRDTSEMVARQCIVCGSVVLESDDGMCCASVLANPMHWHTPFDE
eukprot:11503153-Ditylum_brightwellii.AAC.1